jgi:predicted PurR-regulated permease PerM
MAIQKLRQYLPDTEERPKGTRANWPYPRLGRKTVLAIGIALLALCLYPFWGTMALAAIFAFGLRQPLTKLKRKLGLSRGLAVGLAVALLVCSLLLPVSFLGLRLYQIASGQKERGVSGIFSAQTSQQLTNAYTRIEETIATYGKKFNMYEDTTDARTAIQENLAGVGKAVIGFFTGALLGIPDLVVSLLIFALFFYLFLAKGEGIGNGLVKLGIVPAGDIAPLTSTFQRCCYDTIVTNLVLGTLQASIVAVGARIFGFKEMAVIFTLTFFLSFIPIIGAAPMAFLLSGVSFLSGNTGAGIGLVVVGLITGSVDNILRPFMISNGEAEGHPVLSFAAIIGAIAVFGLKGLFLGPVILTTTLSLLSKPSESKH